MATKTTKKAPAKKAAATKKAAPKKTVRPAPVAEDIIIMDARDMHHAHHAGHGDHGCGCGGNCGCGCHDGACKCGGGCWGVIKKIFWFLVVFALGFAACMFLCNGSYNGRRGPKMPVEFVNGCLDVAQIKCPEFAKRVMMADANRDNCITRDEYRAFKKQARSPRQ